jgi:uncharacterized membrane protein YesL
MMANPIESIHSPGRSSGDDVEPSPRVDGPSDAQAARQRDATPGTDRSPRAQPARQREAAPGTDRSPHAQAARQREATPGTGWSSRLREAADTLTWVAGLNLLWIGFTLAGLVVLGAAPASTAAATVTRRRLRGDSEPLVRAFASAWRADFIPANRLLLPIVAIDALLVANWAYYSQQDGALTGLVSIASVVGMVLALAAGAVVVTMRAHYDLAGGPYRTAARWMALNPGSVLLLAVTATLVGAVTAFIPGLLPFLSIGVWLTVSTGLCLSFFAHNDQLVAASREHHDLSDAGARD